MSTRPPPNKYLENKVLTASKEELMLMLFDGAIRFCGAAKEKVAARDFEESCRLLIRGQDIMNELSLGLRREELGDRIYENLTGLYAAVSDRLMSANMSHDLSLVDEAVKLLSNLRETWAMAIEKDRKERQGPMATAVSEPRPSINFEG